VEYETVLLASDLPAWLVRGGALMFGALWGSFFNVAIYRWPRGMSVVKPPSHCPACGAPVRWYLNVPILGYVLLGGRARCCGAKMTSRYVWVEVLGAVLCLAIAERYLLRADPETLAAHGAIDTLLYFAFAGGLLIATFVDLEWMEIPDEVSLPGAALGLATAGLRTGPGALSAAIGAGVGFLIVQGLFVTAYELLAGRRGMGEGDAKLLLMIGAFLGWEAVLFTLVAGSMQGLIAAGLGTALGIPLVPSLPDEASDADAPAEGSTPAAVSPEAGASEDEPAGPTMMVFGPMLALSALEFLFFGDAILAWVSVRFAG
jgi:leader peptidase (prepilin peptidase)/N-methyltransferase